MKERRSVWLGFGAVATLLLLLATSSHRSAHTVRGNRQPVGSTSTILPMAVAASPSTIPPPPSPVSLPPAPYEDVRVLAQREGKPDADGVSTRTRLLETDGKYPFVRVEETRRHDRATGKTFTLWRVAMVADHILVRLHRDATEADLDELNRQFDATIRRRLKREDHYLVAFSTFDLQTVPRRVRDYRASPWVTEVAEPDYLVELVDTVPDDPRYAELWGLSKIRCPEAWDIETGNGSVVVGVIDSGVDTNHEDLVSNLWVNPWENPTNGIDDDANGYIDDVHGWDFGNDDASVLGPSTHGTHVAGTVAAAGNNSTGVVGVSWNSLVMVLKMFSDGGSGATSDAIDALDYVITMRGRGVPIRLTNNSWGGGGYSSLLENAIEDTGDVGMLFVAAAGNYALNNDVYPFYPASYDSSNILAVAASTSSDRLTSFSHYGASSVDLAAPGINILSTIPGGYGNKSGTSMASPHVAGACALLWEAYPEATWEQVRDFVMTSVKTDAYLLGRMVSGGRLDMAAAIQATDPVINHVPLENTTNTMHAYVVEAAIGPTNLLVMDSVNLHWNTSGSSGSYMTLPMLPVSNGLFRASIPAQPLGGHIYYYITAESSAGLGSVHPVTAPSTPHHFQVVDSVVLWVSGRPGQPGEVVPDYGVHQLPRGITVHAEADRFSEETAESRYECVGWAARGSAPSNGVTNRVDFALSDDTALSWAWELQYSLTHSTVPPGAVDTVTWWEADTEGQTETAPDPVIIGAHEYRFVEWRIDNSRWPNATNEASNPATSVVMSMGRQAVAVYLRANEDRDGDGLPDWWERRQFGDLTPTIEDDPDSAGLHHAPLSVQLFMVPDSLSNVVVSLSNTGATGINWSAVSGWMDGVEAGPNGVLHRGVNDLWHISTNRAYTGTHAWYCGDPDLTMYLDQVDASLELPPVFPVDGALFTFRYWADIEYDTSRNDDHYWDGGIVEISTNGGASFAQIDPIGGYPHRITPNDQSPFPYDTPCFGGDGVSWEEATFDLSAYAGHVAHLRIRFGSDWAVTEEGWYIDDIAMIFPAPMAGWLGIQPDSGSLAPGENNTITVRVDTAGMPTASLPGMVRIATDDPLQPFNTMDVVLSVQAASDLTFLAAASSSSSATGAVIVFEWLGYDDRFYTLHERRSLVDAAEAWTVVEEASNLPGVAGTMSYTVDVEQVEQRFYRLSAH